MEKIKDIKFLRLLKEKYNINDYIYNYYIDNEENKKIVITNKNIYIFLDKVTEFNKQLSLNDGLCETIVKNKDMLKFYRLIVDENKNLNDIFLKNICNKYDFFPDFHIVDDKYIILKCNNKYKKILSSIQFLNLPYYNNKKDFLFKKILKVKKEEIIKNKINQLINLNSKQIDSKIKFNDAHFLNYRNNKIQKDMLIDNIYLNFMNFKSIKSFCLVDDMNRFKIIALPDLFYTFFNLKQTIEIENL